MIKGKRDCIVWDIAIWQMHPFTQMIRVSHLSRTHMSLQKLTVMCRQVINVQILDSLSDRLWPALSQRTMQIHSVKTVTLTATTTVSVCSKVAIGQTLLISDEFRSNHTSHLYGHFQLAHSRTWRSKTRNASTRCKSQLKLTKSNPIKLTRLVCHLEARRETESFWHSSISFYY